MKKSIKNIATTVGALAYTYGGYRLSKQMFDDPKTKAGLEEARKVAGISSEEAEIVRTFLTFAMAPIAPIMYVFAKTLALTEDFKETFDKN